MTVPDSLKGRVDGIVIGASAGGVEALSIVLPALSAAMPVAVFVVLHLPRERPSLLVEIFRNKCGMSVREAQDKEPAEPGAIYFAPPDYHLLIDQGPALALSADDLVNYSRPSIDVLFESAADVYADRLLGIVLTGGNQDGAAGLEAIRRARGITLVQDPSSAQTSLMPASALARGRADYVLDLPRIASLLRTLSPEKSA